MVTANCIVSFPQRLLSSGLEPSAYISLGNDVVCFTDVPWNWRNIGSLDSQCHEDTVNTYVDYFELETRLALFLAQMAGI